MYDLKCKRQDCEYNKNWNCTVKNLEIQDDTSCNTYVKSNEAEIGEIERIDQPAILKNINVDCKANCLFNNKGKCVSNGISISNKDTATCITNIPK